MKCQELLNLFDFLLKLITLSIVVARGSLATVLHYLSTVLHHLGGRKLAGGCKYVISPSHLAFPVKLLLLCAK